MTDQQKPKKEDSKEDAIMYTACTVQDCACKEYLQPTSGNKCARSGCGHSSQKHTG
jgi:hypothetical protein